MCISILQSPKWRMHTLANYSLESFYYWGKTFRNSPSQRLFGSKTYAALEGGPCKRWTRRDASTKSEGRNKNIKTNRISTTKHEVLDATTLSTSGIVDINRTDRLSEIPKIKYSDIRQKIAESKENLADLITVIVCDTETTGLGRENRIIEFASLDLAGGENSTFETLVNPDRFVSNSNIHGITNDMVRKRDVPRMEELIPILLQYVKSREKPEGYILWVAHNGRRFDFPLLINEFNRCSYEVPSNWLYLDTLYLAREMTKSPGLEVPGGCSLQALREHYNLQLVGAAHRAMSDVQVLSLVFQRLTFDMKLTMSELIVRSFTEADIMTAKKKKS